MREDISINDAAEAEEKKKKTWIAIAISFVPVFINTLLAIYSNLFPDSLYRGELITIMVLLPFLTVTIASIAAALVKLRSFKGSTSDKVIKFIGMTILFGIISASVTFGGCILVAVASPQLR